MIWYTSPNHRTTLAQLGIDVLAFALGTELLVGAVEVAVAVEPKGDAPELLRPKVDVAMAGSCLLRPC